MCGRYVSARTVEELAGIFAARDDAGPLEPDYNVAPTRQAPVVTAEAGERRLTTMRWGLVPPWARDPSVGRRMINARVETAAVRPAYRAALRHRRALVPADGYYEWRHEGGRAQPYYLYPEEGSVLAFAGLYEVWCPPGGEPLRTFTILTTQAPDDLGVIHPRAPLTVPPQCWQTWLEPTGQPPGQLLDRLLAAVPGRLRAHPVDPGVGNVRARGPALIRPVPPQRGVVSAPAQLPAE